MTRAAAAAAAILVLAGCGQHAGVHREPLPMPHVTDEATDQVVNRRQ